MCFCVLNGLKIILGRGDTTQRLERLTRIYTKILAARVNDIEVIDVIDNVVQIKLLGACGTCPMSDMTMKAGVELSIKNAIPERH